MIIFGFGHRTTKMFGAMNVQRCGRCNNNVARQLMKISEWFTLFFIPVFPYRTEYAAVCPICGESHALSKEEFDRLADGGSYYDEPSSNGGGAAYTPRSSYDNNDKYAGKSEMQINFLKEMEELHRRKEADRS